MNNKRKRHFTVNLILTLIPVVLVLCIMLVFLGASSSGFSLTSAEFPGSQTASASRTAVQEMGPDMPDTEDWMLALINSENPLPDGFSPELKKISNGLEFDSRAIAALNEMLDGCRAAGLDPVVCSAYRSLGFQEQLFQNQVAKQLSYGYSQEVAEDEARKVVAYPGTSEHNGGLAADIVSSGYQMLDDAQADTAEMKWLVEHCSDYGFILRYPKDKTEITGIIYEPWHFRYVGVLAAKEITEAGLCLEEYLGF